MLYSFTYIGQHRPIMLVLLFGLFPILLMLPAHSMLVVFAEDVWQVGEDGLGLLMATVGAGGISGAFIVARFSQAASRARWMLCTGTLFGVALAAFSMSPWFGLALLLMLCASMLNDITQTMNNTIVQLLAHNEVRGRMSSMMMVSLGLTPLGVLPVALAAERFGIAPTMLVASLILLCILALFFALSPTLRRLDHTLQRAAAVP